MINPRIGFGQFLLVKNVPIRNIYSVQEKVEVPSEQAHGFGKYDYVTVKGDRKLHNHILMATGPVDSARMLRARQIPEIHNAPEGKKQAIFNLFESEAQSYTIQEILAGHFEV